MAMDLDRDVSTVLGTLRSEAADSVAELFYAMEDLYERKLWHQLTIALQQLFQDENSRPLRYRVFTQFISNFDDKISQLAYVTFGLEAAKQCDNSSDALAFLTNIADKVKQNGAEDAYVYAETEIARVKLSLKDIEGARELLDKAQATLDGFDSVDPIIFAAFYGVSSDYHKDRGDFTAYYRNALLYLACINLEDLRYEDQQVRAYELSIAALLGDEIYNFGELLLHPILESLKGTEYSWLVDILLTINAGDVKKFEGLEGHLAKAPLLQESLSFLKQKVSLTSLTEAVFKRPVSDRNLSFTTIAEETHLVPGEVEYLVMKALSLGLIKGTIDEVDQIVKVTWLQPRVMNKEQIQVMQQKLARWDEEVKNLGQWMQTKGSEIWTAA